MPFRTTGENFEMIPPTGVGREFSAHKRVRLGDATPSGRLRLDAMARYLQDVSNDDTRDAQWSDPHWWVVRRTVLDVHRFPRYLEEINLTTWCGGVGSHWAERRTRMTSLEGELLVDAAALWVHVDQHSLQPSRIPTDVASILEESAQGRTLGARLLLRQKDFAQDNAVQSSWPLRYSDLDAVGHMNNAAYWEIVEEHLGLHHSLRAPMRGIVEHVMQVEPHQQPVRHSVVRHDELDLQLHVGDIVHAAMWCGTRH